MKKVLITGASGFVGYHLIVTAIAQGLAVYAAVRKNSDIAHLKDLDINYVNLNFSDVAELKAELEDKQYAYIIHAAGTTKAKTLADYNNINAEYSKNLALAAASVNYALEKFMFVSSLAAIGPLESVNGVIEDDTAANPISLYGASKKLAEDYLNTVENLPLIIVRPTAVYGPREKDIFILFKTINQGLEPYIGKVNQRLSFIYVKDLAEIVMGLLKTDIIHKTYNISDGSSYDRYALANGLKEGLNKRTLKLHIPLGMIKGVANVLDKLYANSAKTPTINSEKIKELTAANWTCSIENLKKDLKFEPKYNLTRGLAESIQWYKLNNWLK